MYIIDEKKYLNQYKKGITKLLPNFFVPNIKPKVLHEAENIIFAGINIKPIDFDDNDDLNKYIEGIKEVLNEEIGGVYLEGQEKLNYNVLKTIEDNTNVKVFYGENIRIKYLPFILKEIYEILNDNLQEKEILILDSDIERIKRTIKTLSRHVAYITVAGLSEQNQNDLYNYILEETGISVFFSNNIERIAGNYNVIINFIDNMDYIINKLKKHSLVFDFSRGENEKLVNRPPLIKDFYFTLNNYEHKEFLTSKEISSSLFEALSLKQFNSILLYAENELYSTRRFAENFLRIKGRF
ncbi:MAG TPA: hypothetical protein VIK77_10775 [Tissierellaceae bacterium]